jgi:hypothetical protein
MSTCPEALFALTLKGRLAGADALLTVRGRTAAEFTANLEAVKGLLEPSAPAVPQPSPPPATAPGTPPPAEGWCAIHGVPMKQQSNERGAWWSHKTAEGWCRGKAKKG